MRRAGLECLCEIDLRSLKPLVVVIHTVNGDDT